MMQNAAVSQKLLIHALSLIGRQQHGSPAEAEAARTEAARWLNSGPQHQAAYAQAQHHWQASDASFLRGEVPLPQQHDARAAANSRRRALTLLGVGGFTALLGTGGWWRWQAPTEQLALRTQRGQLLAHDLPDGSHIDLAANTQLQITYYRQRREALLTHGEARFAVQTDTIRPFHVLTPLGSVKVLGTVFSVSVRGNSLRVAVAEGRVAVWAGPDSSIVEADAPASAVLQAGQSIEANAGRTGPVHSVRPESVGAWRDGWLVFNATPLPEAIARWNDYLAQPIRVTDANGLQSLRLTGTFPVRDPSGFVENLPEMLPVRVQRGTAGYKVSAKVAAQPAR